MTRIVALATAFVLVGTSAQAMPASAQAGWVHPVAGDITHVKGVVPAVWRQYPVWLPAGREVRGNQSVAWPAEVSQTVEVAASAVTEQSALSRATKAASVKAGASPVWLAPVAQEGFDTMSSRVPAPSLSKVALRVHAQSKAAELGLKGVLLEVGRADGVPSTSQVAVTVDYRAFAQAVGGDWSSRLRMVQLPACALTTPAAPGCATAKPLPSANDTKSQTVTAVAPLAADTGTLVMLSSAPSGDNGDYTATSLSAASTWEVSMQTGAFTWSHPFRMVPGVGGPQPSLSLSYSSQTMDGRTGGSNTQGSWIGDGFDMWPGFVERAYKGCSEDTGPVGGQDPNNKNNKTGDQCWFKSNATLSLNGRSTELVDAGSGQWKGVTDDGSRIERLVGGGNGDNDGEYWKVTTIDGMQYFFGSQFGPGGASASRATEATWTTQVYGNHPGEPGYVAGNFAGSRQTQAWRWNLSYVVDPHGNTMTLFYGKETGAYGRELDPTKRTTYDRGGYLTSIEYGNRADASASTHAAAKVVFDIADRCKPSATCFDGQGKAIEASFPDTPFDQYCYAAPCTDKLSPTFWTQKRLAKIRTQVSAGGGNYTDVESWTLRHEYLDAGVAVGEGVPMFLRGITRTGHVTTAGGNEETDPEIVLSPGADPLPNRVDDPNDNRTALNRWRIQTITTETGAQILVNYKQAECVRSALPTAHNNGKLCFPQYYAPEGMTPTLDWFHKYVVAKVTANDNAAGSESQETHYDYLDAPAWHYDDSELVAQDKRTWGQFRGFGHVRSRKGFTTGVQLTNESRYLRGMDGDTQPTGVRDVWVTDSWGTTVEDHPAYAGRLLESRTVDGVTGQWVSGSVDTPTTPVNTATAGVLKAWMVNTGATGAYSRTTAEADGVRWVRTATKFNSDNLPYEVDDLGDETTSNDDRCTRTWYARNATNWMLDRAKRTETVGVKCSTTPSLPSDMVGSSRTTYDDPGRNWDVDLPVRGLPVKTEEIDHWIGATPQWRTTSTNAYDANGRGTMAADALSRTTTTVFTPALAGPVTQVDVFNAKNDKTTSIQATPWNLPITTTNANGVQTEFAYDGLGRLIKVWLPGRAKPSSASAEFDYRVRNTAPTVITARRLLPTGSGYTTKTTLFDGWLRERQIQAEAPGGGRVITETHYDSRGLKWWTSAPFFDGENPTTEPNTTLYYKVRVGIPSVTEIQYDGAGRPVAEILQASGLEKWRSTTTYAGDLTTVTPPDGGTRTETLVDGRGRTVQIRRYHQRTGASGYDATSYTFTDAGNMATVTDPAGNVWRYFYDQRGRKVRDEDPDKGITVTEYDLAGQAVKVTDARQRSIVTKYDSLGRRENIRDGSDTGPLRAEWLYDTLPNGIGKVTKATRYDNGAQYVNEVTSYDTAGRTTGTKITIPASEGALCAASAAAPCSFSYSTTYKHDGQLSTMILPKAGDLNAEQLAQNYNDVGAPTTLTSSAGTLMRSVGYAKNGLLTQRTLGPLGKQVAIDYTIDEATGRLMQTRVSPENKPVPLDLNYSYDAAGNLIGIQDTPFGQQADTQCYRYDHLRRLVNAWTPATVGCTPDPSVAALGGPAPYWQSFEYTGALGASGGRTKDIWHAAAGDTSRTYSYPSQAGPAGSRPHALSRVDTDVPTGTDTVDAYLYDDSGNTSRRTINGVVQDLFWDNEGRLSSTNQPGAAVTYVYDAEGEKLIRRDPQGTGTTLYLPGGTELTVAPGSSTAKCTRYYKHFDVLIGVRTAAAGLTFVIGDHHGTSEANIASADLSVKRRRTLPFGDMRGAAPSSWAGDKSFVGGTKEASGLVYVGARLYEAANGRFISVDPVMDAADPQQMHGYGYSNNNPGTFSDPTGLLKMAEGEGGGGGPICSGRFCQGDRKVDVKTSDLFKDAYPYDPKEKATWDDRMSWAKWGGGHFACEIADMVDKCQVKKDSDIGQDALDTYGHYRSGKGTDLELDYTKAYYDDPAIWGDIEKEIRDAQIAAESLLGQLGVSTLTMTGDLRGASAYPVTENWQKAIGDYETWSSATVEVQGNKVRMVITIHAQDRYNFNNKNAKDITTGIADAENGRFQTLGWAKAFNTHGQITREVTWIAGSVESVSVNPLKGR